MPSRIGNYTLTRTLGEGGQGKVKLGTDKDGNQWAVKIITLENADQHTMEKIANTRAEATAMMALQHENIVPVVEFNENAEWIRGNG